MKLWVLTKMGKDSAGQFKETTLGIYTTPNLAQSALDRYIEVGEAYNPLEDGAGIECYQVDADCGNCLDSHILDH